MAQTKRGKSTYDQFDLLSGGMLDAVRENARGVETQLFLVGAHGGERGRHVFSQQTVFVAGDGNILRDTQVHFLQKTHGAGGEDIQRRDDGRGAAVAFPDALHGVIAAQTAVGRLPDGDIRKIQAVFQQSTLHAALLASRGL